MVEPLATAGSLSIRAAVRGLVLAACIGVLASCSLTCTTAAYPTSSPTASPNATVTTRVEGTAAPHPDPPLAAVFAGWYGFNHQSGECEGGIGSTHWNDGPNTGGVVYQPDPGYYCSANPSVIKWQAEQMTRAGIKVLLFSWWGWGDTNLDGTVEGHPDQYMGRALNAWLDYLADSGSDLKIAVIVEPFPETQAELASSSVTTTQRHMILDYLWNHYYSQHPDQMFHWHGNPLVVSFDPMRLPSDPRFTIRSWTGKPRESLGLTEHWDWSFAPGENATGTVSEDGVAFVYPRFDESHLVDGGASYIHWKPRRIDPLLSGHAYRREWAALEKRRASVRLIVVYSWNLYGEQAQIEPSDGGTAPVRDDYVNKTRQYYEAFLANRSVAATTGSGQ